MTPTQRQAMEQALEALESLFGIGDYYTGAGAGGVAVWREGGSAPVEAAMAALLNAALAETAEPVAWLVCSVNFDGTLSLEHAAAWREAAHEHINDAITEHGIEEAASWVVRPAYTHPTHETKKGN